MLPSAESPGSCMCSIDGHKGEIYSFPTMYIITLLTGALKGKDIFMEVLVFWPPEWEIEVSRRKKLAKLGRYIFKLGKHRCSYAEKVCSDSEVQPIPSTLSMRWIHLLLWAFKPVSGSMWQSVVVCGTTRPPVDH